MGQITVEQMIRHVLELSRAFRIIIVWENGPRDVAMAGRLSESVSTRLVAGTKVIRVPVIKDATGYAVVLHEMGHHEHPLGFCRADSGMKPPTMASHPRDRHRWVNLMRMEEDAAWEWAQHMALTWTIEMEATKVNTRISYEYLKKETR